YQEIKPSVKANLFINKGKLYAALHESKLALNCFDSAFLYATTPDQKASIKIHKMFFFINHKDFRGALAEFSYLEPLLKQDSINSQNKAKIYMGAGGAFVAAGDYKNATKYLSQADSMSRFLLATDARILKHFMSDLYYQTGQYRKAYELHYAYHETEDSIRSREIQLKVSELDTRYRTAEKDKTLAEQQLLIMKSSRQLYKSNVISVSIVATLIILLLLLWLRYTYQKRKNQRLESAQEIGRLNALREGEEKERHRLSHELHDGINSSLAATSSYLHTLAEMYPTVAVAVPFQKIRQMLQSVSSE